jgi:hypothetical protein
MGVQLGLGAARRRLNLQAGSGREALQNDSQDPPAAFRPPRSAAA